MIIGSIEFLVQFYDQTLEEGRELPLHFAGVVQLSTGCLSQSDKTVNKQYLQQFSKKYLPVMKCYGKTNFLQLKQNLKSQTNTKHIK